MKVLAIDPGSVCAGYAVLALHSRRMTYVTSGVLRFNGQDHFLDRIKSIYDQTCLLMREHAPDEVALEALIFAKSPTSLMKLAQARGAMLAALTQGGAPVFEYAPTAVKAAVSGHGGTDKEGLQKLLCLHLGAAIDFRTHDESDAVAVAICHLLHKTGPLGTTRRRPAAKKGKGLAASLSHRIKEAAP